MKKYVEGELFKIITLHGRSFELRYGYYEDYERESEYSEPIPIYPDFLKEPQYTDEGHPFVTQMQTLCEHGKSNYSDGVCADCSHFLYGEELIGICKCESRRKTAPQNHTMAPANPNRLEDKL